MHCVLACVHKLCEQTICRPLHTSEIFLFNQPLWKLNPLVSSTIPDRSPLYSNVVIVTRRVWALSRQKRYYWGIFFLSTFFCPLLDGRVDCNKMRAFGWYLNDYPVHNLLCNALLAEVCGLYCILRVNALYCCIVFVSCSFSASICIVFSKVYLSGSTPHPSLPPERVTPAHWLVVPPDTRSVNLLPGHYPLLLAPRSGSSF